MTTLQINFKVNSVAGGQGQGVCLSFLQIPLFKFKANLVDENVTFSGILKGKDYLHASQASSVL